MRTFSVVFLALLVVLFGLELLQPVQQHVVVPFTTGLAAFSAWLVGPFDPHVVAIGKIIMNRQTGMAVSVESGCNGVEACLVLTAAIWAFPASIRARVLGWLIGMVAVQALNVLRIISLFYLLQWDRSWFDFAHEYLWQGLIMLDVLIVFLLWTHKVAQRSVASSEVPAVVP